MDSDELSSQLVTITQKFLQESGINYQAQIKLDMSLQRHLGIDSLMRAELFHRVEKQFNVEVPDHLLIEVDTLNDLITYLEKANPVDVTHKNHTLYSHTDRPHINVNQAETLIDIILLYGKQAPQKAHIYFQHEDGQQEAVTYGGLLQAALQVAQGLREVGLKVGDTVALMLPTQPEFFYAFYGILLAGGVPVPIYPPFRLNKIEVYAETEAHILRSAQARYLITFTQAALLSRLLQTFVPSLKRVVTIKDIMHSTMLEVPFQAKPTDFAFIQYTSGSTSQPKGVLLTHANLLANIRAYGEAIQVTADDVAVSWLPLYHDMGLIGMWFGSLYFGAPLVLMTPFAFLNHPEKWLWAIHQHRGTISAAPNFAYDLCLRKIDPARLEGLDLSSWRIAANGAEKVYARTLQQFTERFAAYGLQATALLPVYGLAESTVGLAIPPLGRGVRLDIIDRKKFEAESLAVPATHADTLTFVACGKPIPQHEIRIVDDAMQLLAERHVGRLQFCGPSSMQGYYNNPTATAEIYHDGWWDSGDLAYLVDGEVYITGRRKDLIIKAGRNIYPTEIEELVGGIHGIRQGCVIAFGVADERTATERLVIVAEIREKNVDAKERILADITDKISSYLDVVPDDIVLVMPHKVPKTSSGKLQRAACKNLYLTRQLNSAQRAPWWQVSKLFIQSTLNKVSEFASRTIRFVYTFYVALLASVTLLLVWSIVIFSSRSIAVTISRFAAKFIFFMIGCPITVLHAENLRRTQAIYVANHASYLDALLMLAILPQETRLVGKRELLRTPILRTFMRRLDYLALDRTDLTQSAEDVKKMQSVLQAGHPILIFPEGTFGYAAGLRPFRLGAFKLSVETSVAICPLAIKGTRMIWRGDEKLLRPARIMVTVLDLAMPESDGWQAVTSLRQQVRTQIAEYCGEPSLDFIAAQTIAPKPAYWKDEK